jgi:hypothetical protein
MTVHGFFSVCASHDLSPSLPPPFLTLSLHVWIFSSDKYTCQVGLDPAYVTNLTLIASLRPNLQIVTY